MSVGDSYVRNTYVRNAGIVNCLGTYLLSSRILKLKQYSPAIEMQVRASLIGQYNIELETGIGVN